MTEPLIAVRDLRTWFRTDEGIARAVDGVSFQIHGGETVGIVGESGCGKTVTALSILHLLDRSAAEIQPGSSITFGGEELAELDPEVRADRERLMRLRGNEIAMIFQEPMSSLNPVFTVGDQVAEAVRRHRGLARQPAWDEAVRLLEQVGIPEPARRVHEYPHQLSGGMRQRVMIAMALSCEPKLLIADEPTTALDVTIQAQILELLADLREQLGMAILLVTHDLGVVAEVCDRVVVMYAGQVVETASVQDLFAAPRHPYTRGLLDSLPRVDGQGSRLNQIPGVVPRPTAWPSGCRFRARCSLAAEGCEAEQELVSLGGERSTRCCRASALDPSASVP